MICWKRDEIPAPECVSVEHDFHTEDWLVADRHEKGVWRVEYQDDDGGCYVTIFWGAAAKQRALDYFEALQLGHLRTIREVPHPGGTVALSEARLSRRHGSHAAPYRSRPLPGDGPL